LLCPTTNQYTDTFGVSNEKDRVVDAEAGEAETDGGINVSSDGVNRINYIQHIHWVWMHVCDIPNIVANFSSTGAYADQPNLSCSN
jgi:hypothetical protein